MDATMTSKVKATITDFVNRGFMFTAFDVTKTLRKDGDHVKHGNINEIVQAMFKSNEMGMYERQTINIPGQPVEPFLYFHPFSDVANYQADWVNNNPDQTGMKNDSATDSGSAENLTTDPAPVGASQAQPVPTSTNAPDAPVTNAAPSSPTVASGKVDAKATRSMKSANRVFVASVNGRLNIPPLLVSQIANKGDMVDVKKILDMASGTKKRLVVEPSNGQNDYMVNNDGRIRLSRSATAYLNGTGNYEIAIDNGKLVVSAI